MNARVKAEAEHIEREHKKRIGLVEARATNDSRLLERKVEPLLRLSTTRSGSTLLLPLSMRIVRYRSLV